MKNHPLILSIVLLLATISTACQQPDEPTPPPMPEVLPPPYGYYTFGDEEIPVHSFLTAEEGHLLLKLSPLKEPLSATTYAIVGVHTALLGEEIDVTRKFHNDDYIFIYEDPVRYFSAIRPLTSGTIFLDRNAAGVVRVKVDVELFDGTRFSYENTSLIPE